MGGEVRRFMGADGGIGIAADRKVEAKSVANGRVPAVLLPGVGNGHDTTERRPREAEAARLIRELLIVLGEDPDRPGLRDTPRRAARSLQWLTRGYERTAEDAVGSGVFEERHESMVLVRDIELYSLCEHHLLPFYGRAHVAYIPDGRIVGLSKVARIVDVFARRLQVQERLTDQVADAMCRVVAPRGVGVIIEAEHLCMMMRGVEKQNSRTVTSALRGAFANCPMTREEFLQLAIGR
jgi:GTP cyclohydrolase I